MKGVKQEGLATGQCVVVRPPLASLQELSGLRYRIEHPVKDYVNETDSNEGNE